MTPHHANLASAPLCEIDGLKIGFRGHDGTVSDAVRDLSLTLAPGERLGIVGESGSGKSLTGRALLGLLPDAAHWSARTPGFAGHDLLAVSPRHRRRLVGRPAGIVL
ncbi:ATP-binding cassette domain-containing protein, partial [Paraburkholderia sp. Se-20369]|nr:ATP-binding cassette domain-containing protein [Paraburkholderia sp. Se-20369]